MAAETIESLKSLHNAAIDAARGYEEAAKESDGHGLTPLFDEMTALHRKQGAELAAALRQAGEAADEDGSFMSTVNRAIMSVRSLFGGLDQSVLGGLIDGETRNVSFYTEALAAPDLPDGLRDLLASQKTELDGVIARMRTMQTRT